MKTVSCGDITINSDGQSLETSLAIIDSLRKDRERVHKERFLESINYGHIFCRLRRQCKYCDMYEREFLQLEDEGGKLEFCPAYEICRKEGREAILNYFEELKLAYPKAKHGY